MAFRLPILCQRLPLVQLFRTTGNQQNISLNVCGMGVGTADLFLVWQLINLHYSFCPKQNFVCNFGQPLLVIWFYLHNKVLVNPHSCILKIMGFFDSDFVALVQYILVVLLGKLTYQCTSEVLNQSCGHSTYRIQWSSHSWYSGKMAGETLCSLRAFSIAFS